MPANVQYSSGRHLRSLNQTLDIYECFLLDKSNCTVSSQPISATVAGKTGYLNNNNITGTVCASNYSSADQLCSQFCKDLISTGAEDDNLQVAALSVQADYNSYCNPPSSPEANDACTELGLGADCDSGNGESLVGGYDGFDGLR